MGMNFERNWAKSGLSAFVSQAGKAVGPWDLNSPVIVPFHIVADTFGDQS